MPNSATSKLTEVATRLLVYEAAADKRAGADQSAAFRVCEKFREPLGKLLGTAGFRSLLRRALTLAEAKVPWLRELHIKEDGSLESLAELEAKPDPLVAAQGEAMLVAELLGLLVNFLGPALTLRLLHDIWPKMRELDF